MGADLQRILLGQQWSDVPLPGGENAQRGVCAGDEGSVHQDIGRIAHSAYAQDMVSLTTLETGSEDPGAVEAGLVYGKEVHSLQRILTQDAGPVKGAGYGGGRCYLIDFTRAFLLHVPLRKLLGALLGGAGGDHHERG